jgi:hypothetical protein
MSSCRAMPKRSSTARAAPGRAGKKGTAVLLVPYPRRRRVEMMLRGARIEAEWIASPHRRRYSPQ